MLYSRLATERRSTCVYAEHEQQLRLQLLSKCFCDIIALSIVLIAPREGKHQLTFSSCSCASVVTTSTFSFVCRRLISIVRGCLGWKSVWIDETAARANWTLGKLPHVHESVNFESSNFPKDTPQWGDRPFRPLHCCFLCSPAPRMRRQTLHGRVVLVLSVRPSNRSYLCDIGC